MEKIQNFTENNIGGSRRFENVKEELIDYQMQYIEKLENGTLKPLPGNIHENNDETFEDRIVELSSLSSSLDNEFNKRYPNLDNVPKEKIREDKDNFFGNVLREIKESRKNDNENWREGLKEIIDNNLNKIGPEIREINPNSDGKTGLVKYNIESVNNLLEYGVNQGDKCLSIHLEDLYKQKKNDSTVSIFSIRDSFSKLAVEIIEKHPEVKTVIARSWLMDSMGKTMGFTAYNQLKKVFDGSGFWGQFINEKGEINKERMKKFLETGIPEFYPTEAFIKTEDFLRKYLPKGKRGLIELKERTLESSKFSDERRKFVENFQAEFNKLPYEDLRKMIDTSILTDFFKTDDGLEMLRFIKKAKEENVNAFEEVNDVRFLELKEKFRNYCEEKENHYIDKEVIIE